MKRSFKKFRELKRTARTFIRNGGLNEEQLANAVEVVKDMSNVEIPEYAEATIQMILNKFNIRSEAVETSAYISSISKMDYDERIFLRDSIQSL